MSSSVTIGGNEIEFFKEQDIPFKLSYQLKDFNFFDKSSGVFSNIFKLPATKQNDLNFGGYRHTNRQFESYLDFLSKKDASVYSGGRRVFKGKAKGKSAGADHYKVQFIGSNLEWASDLANQQLNSLTHPVKGWNDTQVESSWTNTWLNRFTAPYVSYGRLNNWADPLPSSNIDHDYNDFRYWHFLRPMIVEMFETNGWRISSSFITGTMFSKLIVYFNDNDVYNADPRPTTIDMGQDLISNDRTCLDLLKGVQHMFNLFFHTDVDQKIVYIEPFDDFFNTSSFVNWDHLRDESKGHNLQQYANFKSSFRLKYPGTDTLIEEMGERDAGVWDILRSSVVTNADLNTPLSFGYDMGSDTFETGVTENENPFFEMSTSGMITQSTTNSIPGMFLWDSYIEDEGERPDPSGTIEPRIAVFGGLKSHVVFVWKWLAGNRATFPYAYTADFHKLDGYNINLNYSDESTDYFHSLVDTFPQSIMSGLGNTYYMNLLTTLRKGQEYTTNIDLSPTEISKIDHRKFHTVENQEHILLEVNKYNPFRELTTKCRFLKRHYIDSSDPGRVTNSEGTNIFSPTLWVWTPP